ncbi:MAG: ribonuclease H-like domain-containing protein [Deltaproteobacteria bacterium]|nr:ribonuclease H-like domain-containing protein [Deltaproteobacteria bacterium]MBW2310722.1 ribonuclease H-like domain-containing protein [Deltaproteobacteria bacterium]
MLERTFIHIPGIGPKTEQRLWQHDILTWNHYLEKNKALLSPARDAFVRRNLEASLENRDNIHFFRERLSPGELWRVFGAFKQGAVYLDIETSGLNAGVDEITVIGIYDGKQVKTFIQGINLDGFETEIASYDLMITFNGAQFDVPFIRRQFPNIWLPPAHIDLRFLLKKLGYRGGLKAIERDCNLVRSSDINGMDGFDAVLLWRAYQAGDKSALERLIQYNTADIVNLKPLMERGYEEMKSQMLSQCFL